MPLPIVVISYDIDPALPDPERIRTAIDHWEAATRIRFVVREAASDYLWFTDAGGSWSYVGRQGGQQPVSVDTACDAGNVVHLIGHAVGLWHEQSRPDRDLFVTIAWENLRPGGEPYFAQHIADGDDVGPYDYDSIMHFGPRAFAIEGRESIVPARSGARIGQRRTLSRGDLAAVQALYGTDIARPLRQLPIVSKRHQASIEGPPAEGRPRYTGFIDGVTFSDLPVTYVDYDGRALVEGDVLIGFSEEVKYDADLRREQAVGPEVARGVLISGTSFRWPRTPQPGWGPGTSRELWRGYESTTRGASPRAPDARGQRRPRSRGRHEKPASAPGRFAVVDLFETETEELASTRKLVADEALQAGTWYALDVSIDVSAKGLPREGETRPIEEFSQTEDARISVLASSADFKIDEPVRSLALPPRGPSRDHAVFHIQPLGVRDRPAELRLHLLYRVNLIEDIVLIARIVPRGAKGRAPGSLKLRHAPVQEFANLEALPPKLMHIHISRRDDQFVFFFVLEVENERIIFNGLTPARLTEATLASDLEAARRALLRIALSHRGEAKADPPGSRSTDPADSRELAKVGRRLWTRLFRERRTAAMFEIGQWLSERQLDLDSLVQVTVDEAAGAFVFPWGLLYDRAVPKRSFEPIETEAFWGFRYVIEQHVPPIRHRDEVEAEFRPAPRTRIERTKTFTAAVLLGNITEASAQESFFASLKRSQVLSLDGGEAMRKPADVLAVLGDCDSDLLSFFAHGYTARPEGGSRSGVDVEDFLKLYDAIPRASLDESWHGPYERIKAGQLATDESWIELEGGRITLQDMVELENRFKRSPVVLMNMCESVQLLPSLSGSFVDWFMGMGAMTVVGTETSVTPRFAHHFGLAFLVAFLGGAPVGTALLETRRRYAVVGDLFGLAYSLYGSGRVTIEPPVEADNLEAAAELARG